MTPYEITLLHQFMADLYVAGMSIGQTIQRGYEFALSEHAFSFSTPRLATEPQHETMQRIADRLRSVSQDLGLTIHQQREAQEQAKV